MVVQGYMRSKGQMPLPTWDEFLWPLCNSFGAEYSDPMTEVMNIKHIGSAASVVHQRFAVKTPRGQGSAGWVKATTPTYRPPVTANLDGFRKRRLTPAEMEEKRAQGLCFFCDDKFTPGHKCKAKRHIYSIKINVEVLRDSEEMGVEVDDTKEPQEAENSVENCEISLQALNGTKGYRTLKIQGLSEQNPINVLIDCGSTHSFINEKAAKRIGCIISQIHPRDISVADGRIIQYVKGSKNFKWLMQGVLFQNNFLVLPIGSCDVVLGIQWLCKLGDIKGIYPSFKTVDAKALHNISVDTAQIFMIEVCSATMSPVTNSQEQEDIPVPIQILLIEYNILSQEPKHLSPSRGVLDHHIALIEGSAPVNSRPYRYFPIQKNVIDDMVKEMMLFAKGSKCVFAATRIEYLGHYISTEGVTTDPKKIETIQGWPELANIKQLRGFLGLVGYYRRFIRVYGVISKPLTNFLKKDSFKWSLQATSSFEKLKKALTSAPVLVLPNFSTPFVVEADACSNGIGAVLMQGGQPIAYLSNSLSPQHQTLSVYHKELLALVMAINKWAQYLTGRPFVVKTDQKALKFLLEQKLHTRS
ncbi:uncharacterized protein LOC142164334 [Nicotiana tabacum]|uniref:Uncharacterized protein LOC142164334 n=1 Tax=Nicotiana tabacum TaxID=4097 RepID=A0AC58S0B3_TOBAC